MRFPRSSRSLLFLVCLCLLAISVTLWPSFGPTAYAGPSGYHILKTYKLGGDGGWDYLMMDSAARRLYISRGTHVMVMDADSGKILGDISDTQGVHGIALIPSLNRGYTSNGRAGSATAFDLITLL